MNERIKIKMTGLLVFACIFAFQAAGLSAESIHVALDGDDKNPGTVDKPVASMNKALELVKDQTGLAEIVIHKGIYHGHPGQVDRKEPIMEIKGTGAHLTIRAALRKDGGYEEVIFDGGQPLPAAEPVPGSPGVFKISGYVFGKVTQTYRPQMREGDTRRQYTLVADLAAVRQYPASFAYTPEGVFFHTSDNLPPKQHEISASKFSRGFVISRPDVTVRGLQFRNFGAELYSGGMVIYGARATVEDCQARNCFYGFNVFEEATNAVIRRCRTDDCAGGVYSQSKHTLIEDCRFFKSRDDSMVPAYHQNDCGIQFYYPGAEGKVRRNLAVGFNRGVFIKCNPSPFLIEQNTFANIVESGIRINNNHQDTVIRSNIIADTPAPIYHCFTTGMIIDYNCLWKSHDSAATNEDMKIPPEFGAHNIYRNPRFAAPFAGDYRLLPDSPCAKLGPKGERCGALEAVGADFKDTCPPQAREIPKGPPLKDKPALYANSNGVGIELEGKTASTNRVLRLSGEPNTRYVSPQGVDGDGRGSQDAPWQTLQFAVDRALPGDRVVLLPGLYAQQTIVRRGGVADAPITIAAMERRTAILDGGRALSVLIEVREAPSIVIDGLELRWFKSSGISVSGSPNVTVKNCTIWNDFWASRVEGYGISAVNSPGLIVDHNVIFRTDVGLDLFKSPRSRVTYNTCCMNVHQGIRFTDSLEHTVVRNNSFAFVGNTALLELRPENQAALATFDCDYNNLGTTLRYLDKLDCPLVAPKKWPLTQYWSKLLIRGDFRRTMTSTNELTDIFSLEEWQRFSGKDRHSIFKDPGYVDVENRNFRLSPHSPNIGAGENGTTIGALGVKGHDDETHKDIKSTGFWGARALNAWQGLLSALKGGVKDGQTKDKTEDYEGARDEYAEALKSANTDQEKADLRLQIGLTCYNEWNYLAALEEFAKVVEMEKADPHAKSEARLHIGLMYYNRKNFSAAKTEFVKVLDMAKADPQHKAEAQLHIGFMCHFAPYPDQNYPAARKEYARVLAMEKADPHAKSEARLHIGHAYYREGNYAAARVEYARVLKMNEAPPDHKSSAQLRSGHAYFKEDNYPAAITEYARLLAMEEASPIYKDIAQGYIEHTKDKLEETKYFSTDYKGARAEYAEALKFAGAAQRKAVFYFLIGQTYYNETNYPAARTEYARVLAMENADPKHKRDARLYMGRAYAGETNYPAARTEYVRVLEMKNADPEQKAGVQSSIASSYYQEKNYPAARKEYGVILGMENVDPERKAAAQYRIGQICYEDEKNYPAARVEFSKVLEMKTASQNYQQAAQIYIERIALWQKEQERRDSVSNNR